MSLIVIFVVLYHFNHFGCNPVISYLILSYLKLNNFKPAEILNDVQ